MSPALLGVMALAKHLKEESIPGVSFPAIVLVIQEARKGMAPADTSEDLEQARLLGISGSVEAKLRAQLEAYETSAVHTCHDECPRAICVLRRKCEWQAEMLERAKRMLEQCEEWGTATDWLADLEKGQKGHE